MDLLLEIIKIVFVAIFGLVFGSFLNVVIYRLPNGMSLIKPASHCPKCDYELKWYDNIPVFSYLFLGGKCRNCHEPISPRYMIVELFTGALFVLTYVIYVKTPETPYYFNAIFGVIFIMSLICIMFIDLEHYIIPNTLVAIIGVCGIAVTIYSIFNPYVVSNGTIEINWLSHVAGLFIGLFILVLDLLVERIVKKELIGGGDIKLLMVSGLFLGWQLLLIGIFFAALIAVLVEIPLSKNKKLRQGHVLPFGPYLGFAFIICFLYGLQLLNGYFTLFGM